MQKIASLSLLSLTTAKGIRTTVGKEKNLPPGAGDFVAIDFRTNYCFVHIGNEPIALIVSNGALLQFQQKSGQKQRNL